MEVFNNLCQATQRILGSCFRSTLNRFASADTIVPNPANPQSFNRYSYVNNNPLKFVDPTGHCREGYMGDDYDDAGCLEIAQSVSHQTGISMDLTAIVDWGIRDARPGSLELTSLDGGVAYKQLRLGEDKAITVGGKDVWSISIAKARPSSDSSGSLEMQLEFALVRETGDAAAFLEVFRSNALTYSNTLEDQYIGGHTKNNAGGNLASDVVDVIFNFADIAFLDLDPGDWVSSGVEGGLDYYSWEIAKTELYFNEGDLAHTWNMAANYYDLSVDAGGIFSAEATVIRNP